MDVARLAKVMKALASQKRVELYLEIVKKSEAGFKAEGECFIMEIIGSLNIGAPTISHHLKELANADLITTERRGKYLIAKVNEKTIADATSTLKIRGRKS